MTQLSRTDAPPVGAQLLVEREQVGGEGGSHLRALAGGAGGLVVDVGEGVGEALLGGLAQSKILEVHGERMLEGRFDPGFRIELHRKDLAIALQVAREEGVALLATAQVAELFNALIAQGDGGRDHSALATLHGQLSGVDELVAS